MADVMMTADTINDGTLITDINEAIEKCDASMREHPDLKGPRTITVKIALTPDGDRFVRTTHECTTKVPVPGRSGIGWKQEGGGLQTSREHREGDGRQMDLERHIDELSKFRGEKKAD